MQNDNPPHKLTPKQQRFIDEYLVDLNATQAAIRAGYSVKTAQEISSENLSKPLIAAAIQKAMDERAKETKVSSKYVLETIIETIERCKQASPVLDRKGEPVYIDTPSGDIVPAYTFESSSVLKGAELLGKHLKLFTDKVESANVNTNLNSNLNIDASKLSDEELNTFIQLAQKAIDSN